MLVVDHNGKEEIVKDQHPKPRKLETIKRQVEKLKEEMGEEQFYTELMWRKLEVSRQVHHLDVDH